MPLFDEIATLVYGEQFENRGAGDPTIPYTAGVRVNFGPLPDEPGCLSDHPKPLPSGGFMNLIWSGTETDYGSSSVDGCSMLGDSVKTVGELLRFWADDSDYIAKRGDEQRKHGAAWRNFYKWINRPDDAPFPTLKSGYEWGTSGPRYFEPPAKWLNSNRKTGRGYERMFLDLIPGYWYGESGEIYTNSFATRHIQTLYLTQAAYSWPEYVRCDGYDENGRVVCQFRTLGRWLKVFDSPSSPKEFNPISCPRNNFIPEEYTKPGYVFTHNFAPTFEARKTDGVSDNILLSSLLWDTLHSQAQQDDFELPDGNVPWDYKMVDWDAAHDETYESLLPSVGLTRATKKIWVHRQESVADYTSFFVGADEEDSSPGVRRSITLITPFDPIFQETNELLLLYGNRQTGRDLLWDIYSVQPDDNNLILDCQLTASGGA